MAATVGGLVAGLGARSGALGELPVQRGNAGEALRVLVGDRPLAEQDLTLCADFGVGHWVASRNAETLEEGLVGEVALEGFACVGDQGIEDLLVLVVT